MVSRMRPKYVMKEGAGMAQRRINGTSGIVPTMSSIYGCGGLEEDCLVDIGWGIDDANAVAYAIAVMEEIKLIFLLVEQVSSE